MSDQPTTPEPENPDTPCRCGGRRPSFCSAPSYEEVCEALDKLHITCESAEPDVYRWYLRHPYAARARAKAINVLNRLQQSQNAGGMARELAAQDSDNSNDING